jgi:predicted nucleic-acid-binding protein
MKTTGIDTNALLAFRLQREPIVNEVKKLFEQTLERQVKVYIPLPVILEVEWVLRSYYNQEKEVILPFFEELLKIDNVIVDNKDELRLAVNLYRESKISFTDSIIVTLVQTKDYDFLTFDKDLEKVYQSLL